MIMKNKYFFHSKVSESKLREIIKLFTGDLTAQQISFFSGISRNSINKILKKIRIRIAECCEQESIFLKKSKNVEADECYFGASRVQGCRGRGAKGKTIVFGLKKRDGKVYTKIVKNCSQKELLSIILRKVSKTAIIYTDGFKSYDSLVHMGYKKHYRVHHGKNEFAKTEGKIKNHINGIENFWGLAKVRLAKFRGMNKETFYLHLKECEFRFNHRDETFIISY